MTEIEQKALELVNEVAHHKRHCLEAHDFDEVTKALCRAIERHEAFRQEVSDAVEAANMRVKEIKRNSSYIVNHMQQYIIAKPDPLVEVIKDLSWDETTMADEWAVDLRAALAKRGGRIVFDD